MSDYQYNGSLVLINLAIWLIAIIKYRKVYYTSCGYHSTDYGFVFFLLALYSTFAFVDADTYHYEYLFDNMRQFGTRMHVENFYFILTRYISNYYVWRFVIWGGASLILVAALKKANMDAAIVGFLLPCFVFREFSLTRGALGISLIMLALTYWYSDKRRLFKYIVAGVCLVASYYLHRSIPIFLLIMVIALMLPFNKRTVTISIVLFPVLYVMASYLIGSVFNILVLDEDMAVFIETYSEAERIVANWKGIVLLAFQWFGLILLTVCLCKHYLNKNNEYSRLSFMMFKYSYVLLYISLLCYNTQYTLFMYSRCVHFATFPLLFCTAEYLNNCVERNRMSKTMLFVLAFYMFYSTVYLVWKWW